MLEPVIVWLPAPALMLKLEVESWALKVWLLVLRPVTVTVSLTSPPLTTTLPLPLSSVASLSVMLEKVMLSAPELPVASVLASRLLIVKVALPLMSSVVLSAI